MAALEPERNGGSGGTKYPVRDFGDFELLTRCLADITATRLRWLWPGRIARGRLCLLIGHPGEGKSWLTMALAAALTLGVPLPGEQLPHDRVRVLVASAEDDPSDTLRPRFDALGGDPRLVTIVDGVWTDKGERGLVLPEDVGQLELELRAAATAGLPYRLLIIDPLAAYLPADLDSHRDVSVRAALAPLARLAQEFDVAVVAVVHLTKGARDTPMLRAQGSIAFTAAARTVLAVGRDPRDPERTPVRHVLMVKSNVAAPAPGLMFTLEAGRFAWLGESPLGGDELMAARTADADGAGGATQLLAAQQFLRDALADGPRWSGDVTEAAIEAGFSSATVLRARQGVATANKYTAPGGARGEGAWYLRLPSQPAMPPSTDPPPARSKLRKRRATSRDQGAHAADESDQGTHPQDGPKTAVSSSEPDLFVPPTVQGAQRAQVESLEQFERSQNPDLLLIEVCPECGALWDAGREAVCQECGTSGPPAKSWQ